jgi:hypothetical protein
LFFFAFSASEYPENLVSLSQGKPAFRYASSLPDLRDVRMTVFSVVAFTSAQSLSKSHP